MLTLSLAHGLTLESFEPVSGLPGTSVRILGQFETDENVEVRLNDLMLVITARDEQALTVTVPATADTGVITVNDRPLPTPFALLREIGGRFDAPDGVGIDGFTAGTAEDVREVDADGTFTALVEKGMPSSVILFRGDQEPAYLALVSSFETEVIVGAASSGEALVLGNPLIGAHSDGLLNDLRPRLRALPSFASLVAAIEEAGSADYLNDARVDAALIASITDLQAAIPQVAAQLGPPFKNGEDGSVRTTNVALRDLNPDPNDIVNPILRNEPSLSSFVWDDPDDVDLLIFGEARARDTGLDWSLKLQELSPFDFPNGLTDIAALEGNDPDTAPVPLDYGLVDAGWVRAKLFSERFDLLKRLTDGARDLLLGSLEKEANVDGTDAFSVPNEPDAIYLMTATSGNFWYGTDWLLVGPKTQEASIDASGAADQWVASAAANMVVAAVDAVSVFLKVKDLGPFKGGYIQTASISVVKTISAYRNSSDKMTKAAIFELIKTLSSDLLKQTAADKAESFPEKAAKFGSMVGKFAGFVAKSFDVLGKISSAGQALERAGTLVSPGTLAMERSILVVGDPFDPKLTSISP